MICYLTVPSTNSYPGLFFNVFKIKLGKNGNFSIVKHEVPCTIDVLSL